jgi:glycosyltransferase involved in cell wall biosynthesis
MNATKTKPRVIVHTPEPGAGAGQYVAAFVNAVAAAGLPIVLFCPSNFEYEEELRASGAEIVHAPVRHIRPAGLWRRILRNLEFAAAAAPKFWATVQRGNIVHFQFTPHFGLSLLYFAIARVKQAFVVFTVHDPLPHRWILPRPLRGIERMLLAAEYRLSNRLIVHNETGKQILIKNFSVHSRMIRVVPHGPLNPRPAGVFDVRPSVTAQPLRLLAFGSLRENKGLHLSIAAVQRLRQDGRQRPVVLTIAGAVPNLRERPYWNQCFRCIETNPAGISVLERTIGDREIPALFASHDAVLLPYVDFYSDSGVAMLALSQGKPILATAAGGLGDLLHEVDCGFLIASPTVEAVMAAVTEAAVLPPGQLQRKGLQGYSHALKHRSWQTIAGRTTEVYDSLSSDVEPTVVLHTPEQGSSAALYVEALCTALTVEKVPVRVVCPANHQACSAMENNPLLDVRACSARATNTKAHLVTKLAQNIRFIGSSCRTLLRATKPGDLVHFQYILHLPFGLVFFACAWARGAHIVFTVHDPVPHKFLLPRVLRRVETEALRLAYRWSDVLIVHSEAGKRKLMEAFQVSEQKIRVIVHGPYELKKAVRACVESNRLEALFFGSLRENKGLHLAIQAVQYLANEGMPVRLTIAGRVNNRKEEEYWRRCRKLMESTSVESASINSVSGVIRLIEAFVPDEELADLFSQCHVFLLPYTAFSSDSGVAYMALANAKPIVSTDAGGLGWLLENSGGGIRIAEASVAGVIAGLQEAAALGPKALEHMGSMGAQWVLAECGWPKVAQETRKVYAEFLPQFSTAEAVMEMAGACDA